MTEALQQFINVLSLGSVYALVALGLAMVFSILGLINFAHGELLTITAYTTWALTGAGVSWGYSVPLAILAALLSAVGLELVAFRPFRGAPPITLLLTSFAVSLVLQAIFLFFIGAQPKNIGYPSWIGDGFRVGGVVVEWIKVVTFGATILILLALNVVLRTTLVGISLRSAAEDFETTRMMGIRANRVVLGAFVISGALAGIAAIFWFSSSGLILPNGGFNPLLKGFIAVIIGGLGTLSGAVVGGFVLAALEVVFQVVLPGAQLPFSDAFVFAVVIAVLLLRPSGILGLRGATV